ncbi:MAG: lytic transglycosylase domain-containing protein [Paracoccus sp. (in: a-proteobacteria)]|nr:lytic transglycosylase domain-containing protein [Paracoccus sp. (in: a-proteobacteria)]
MIGRRGILMLGLGGTALLAGCGGGSDRRLNLVEPRGMPTGPMPPGQGPDGLYANETPELRRRINYWAQHHGVPVGLVHRVIIRESRHRPGARNGPYYGLMQILPQTARTMGYRGPAEGLLNADTNLQYAVKYLRGAYIVADRNHDAAVRWYARGYYYEARRKGLLKETGLRA